MNKIKEFKYMPSLRKSELYSFMMIFEELKKTLDNVDPDDRPDIVSIDAAKEKYKSESKLLNDQILKLEMSFNKRTPSVQTKCLSEQNTLIKSTYRSIVDVVHANLRFKTAEDYEKILNLSLLLKKYFKITTANFKEITALVDNLLKDIEHTQYSDIIKKLSLQNWITIMTNSNSKFKSESMKRSDTYENIISYNYNMKQSIINSYHEVEFCINALAFSGEFSDYDTFINSLNGTITDYIEILQKRLTTFKNKKNKNYRPEIILKTDTKLDDIAKMDNVAEENQMKKMQK